MMHFKSKLLLLSATVLLSVNVFSQKDDDGESYDDLRVLYMDGKYEKLVAKSEKYSKDDDTRKDPTPYLYLSKAYFEMSRNEEFHKKFPPEKSFREALKWATKYRRKDKEGALFEENDLYFRELKQAALEEAGGLMSDQNYSRAKRYYDAITDFDPNDPGAWLMLGYCQVQIRNVMEAKLNYKTAGQVLQTRDLSSLNSVERKLLLEGVVSYSDYLMSEGMRDSARVTVNLAKPALDGDREFDALVNKVN